MLARALTFPIRIARRTVIIGLQLMAGYIVFNLLTWLLGSAWNGFVNAVYSL